MDLGSQHVVILGAGIAGLSAASSLLQRGIRRITVVDEQPAVFTRASGMNAAIFRPLETDPVLAQLAAQSLVILERLQASSSLPLLRKTGLLMLSSEERVLSLMNEQAQSTGIHHERLTARAAEQQLPGLHLEPDTGALWSVDGGVLDPHELGQVLARQALGAGVQFFLGQKVTRLLLGGQGHCVGVELLDGKRLEADAVVLCTGSATGRLSFDIDAPLPLLPLQRHLAILEPERAFDPRAPVVWQLGRELYFRPESGGVLVSPCDETPQTGMPQAQLSALCDLADRFSHLYPDLARARVRSFWACVRTKAPDTRPVIGEAPTVSGLFYLAALAGFGMSCGLGCGEILADCIIHDRQFPDVSPARLYLPLSTFASSSNMRSAGV